MLHTIENGVLSVTVNDLGAELWDVRALGERPIPCLWDGAPGVWPRRAPVCFPWCGRVEEGWFQEEGVRYEAGPHGFVRELEHTLAERGEHWLRFRLDWPGDGRRWPWAFTFETLHRLEGNRLTTTCTAVNHSIRPMPVQLGFHPGFRCPLDPDRSLEDYAVRFQQPEALDGTDLLLLTPSLFDQDSLCFQSLQSDWVRLEELETGRYLQVGIEGTPYLLLWSQKGIPGFLCIEPWTGYPGPGHDLSVRPGVVLLEQSEKFCYHCTLTVSLK